jgi:plasmid stabilization system protein ParE
MKRPKEVDFSPEAGSQIVGTYEYLADHAAPVSAKAYADAIVECCQQLGETPLTGIAREDIRPGLRTAFFRKRVVIAYALTSRAVTVLVGFHGGQDDESLLRDQQCRGAGMGQRPSSGLGQRLARVWRVAAVHASHHRLWLPQFDPRPLRIADMGEPAVRFRRQDFRLNAVLRAIREDGAQVIDRTVDHEVPGRRLEIGRVLLEGREDRASARVGGHDWGVMNTPPRSWT